MAWLLRHDGNSINAVNGATTVPLGSWPPTPTRAGLIASISGYLLFHPEVRLDQRRGHDPVAEFVDRELSGSVTRNAPPQQTVTIHPPPPTVRAPVAAPIVRPAIQSTIVSQPPSQPVARPAQRSDRRATTERRAPVSRTEETPRVVEARRVAGVIPANPFSPVALVPSRVAQPITLNIAQILAAINAASGASRPAHHTTITQVSIESLNQLSSASTSINNLLQTQGNQVTLVFEIFNRLYGSDLSFRNYLDDSPNEVRRLIDSAHPTRALTQANLASANVDQVITETTRVIRTYLNSRRVPSQGWDPTNYAAEVGNISQSTGPFSANDLILSVLYLRRTSARLNDAPIWQMPASSTPLNLNFLTDWREYPLVDISATDSQAQRETPFTPNQIDRIRTIALTLHLTPANIDTLRLAVVHGKDVVYEYLSRMSSSNPSTLLQIRSLRQDLAREDLRLIEARVAFWTTHPAAWRAESPNRDLIRRRLIADLDSLDRRIRGRTTPEGSPNLQAAVFNSDDPQIRPMIDRIELMRRTLSGAVVTQPTVQVLQPQAPRPTPRPTQNISELVALIINPPTPRTQLDSRIRSLDRDAVVVISGVYDALLASARASPPSRLGTAFTNFLHNETNFSHVTHPGNPPTREITEASNPTEKMNRLRQFLLRAQTSEVISGISPSDYQHIDSAIPTSTPYGQRYLLETAALASLARTIAPAVVAAPPQETSHHHGRGVPRRTAEPTTDQGTLAHDFDTQRLAQYDPNNLSRLITTSRSVDSVLRILDPMTTSVLPAGFTLQHGGTRSPFDQVLDHTEHSTVPNETCEYLFGNYLRQNPHNRLISDFLTYVRTTPRFSSFARTLTESDSDPAQLRDAVLSYINFKINNRSPNLLDGADHTDFDILERFVLPTGSPIALADGIRPGSPQMTGLTLSALSIISWRLENPTSPIGQWASSRVIPGEHTGFTPIPRSHSEPARATIPMGTLFGPIDPDRR